MRARAVPHPLRREIADAICQGVGDGLSFREVAARAGCSPARVSQVYHHPPAGMEAALLGARIRRHQRSADGLRQDLVLLAAMRKRIHVRLNELDAEIESTRVDRLLGLYSPP